ncbi:MAG: DNA polymerase III subunit beta [Candidatus Omnitrophota bacterium]|nr:MAG: DNA polymerase III subunit beta [Candidatus Omnitrophota bacterium]
MKFNINKEILLETLQKILGPTTTKQNFPTLNSVLILATHNKLKFITTDLDITIISTQEAEIIDKGKTLIPMKRFVSNVRELPPSNISVELVKNNLLIRCEKIEFKITTFDPEEFPKIEEKTEASFIKIDPQDLEEMIRFTSFCVGYEDVNYVLNGILFEVFGDKINLVSTDGKRLSFVQRRLPSTQPTLSSKLSFILPIKAIIELHKLIKEREEEVFLFVEDNKVGFDFKGTQFLARPIEGEFPNYSQYIPQEGKDKLIINRKSFLFALRRAELLSTSDYQSVKLELQKEGVALSKSTPQLGEVKEVVEASFSGAPIQIGFNPSYLMDVLKNLEDESVVLEFFGPEKPAVLRKEGYVYLILPMKI